LFASVKFFPAFPSFCPMSLPFLFQSASNDSA
jgi:hypothetical protein